MSNHACDYDERCPLVVLQPPAPTSNNRPTDPQTDLLYPGPLSPPLGPFAPRLRVPPPPRNRGWFGAAAPPNANPQGLGTGAGAGAGGGVLEEVDAMASDEFDDDSDGEEEAQARLAAILGARADRAAAQGIGGTGGLGAGAAAGMEGMEEGDGEEGLGVEVEVDEEGVLQLMEILELPRSAAIELLQSHEGDVQAAVLSVMS